MLCLPPPFYSFLPNRVAFHNTSLAAGNANESSLSKSICSLPMCPWGGCKKMRDYTDPCGDRPTKLAPFALWAPWSPINASSSGSSGITKDLFCISHIICVSTSHKERLPSWLCTHRSEIAPRCLNSHFSVQPNSCWRSSLLSENSPLPLFNPLGGERKRVRETNIQCWQGHNLPSLHTLFTVSFPAAVPRSLSMEP